jgi:autotransporter-associated beta strand protein
MANRRLNGARLRVLAAAVVAAATVPTVALAQSGTWTQNGTFPPYNWSTAGNWQGNIIANGQDNTATFNTAGLQGLFDVTLDSSRTIGNLVFSNPTNTFGWQIDGGNTLTLQTSTGTPTITVSGANLTATIATTLAGTQGFIQQGTGTLVLNSVNGFTGATTPVTVNQGTLALDFSLGAPANILPATTDLALGNGGNVNMIVGAGQAPTQGFNSLTVNAGASTVAATLGTGSTFGLTLGNITRNTGSTVVFNAPGTGATLSTTSSNGAGTILGGWATFYNPSIPATNAQHLDSWAVITAGNIAALPNASYVNDTWASGNNTTVTTSTTQAAGATTNSVRFNGGGGNNFVVSLAGANTITSGGILITPNPGTGGSTNIVGGTITSGASDLVITNHNAFSNFTLQSGIVGAIGLTTAGNGQTILSGNNTYTGPTYVNGTGTALFAAATALPGYNAPGLVNVTSGGTLAVGTGGWASADIDTLRANATFAAGSALGIDVPSGNTFSYGSNIGGGLGVAKNNAGTLNLTGNSTYTGDTTVNGGVLTVSSVANAGTASPIGAGQNLVLGTGGTFQYTGPSATVNRGINVAFNGGAIDVNQAGTNLGLSGLVTGPGGLTKVGTGTLTISGTGNYLGPTVINAGTMVFSGANSLPSGNDLTIAPGATATLGAAATPNIGALQGGGTLNLGSATSLTIGSDAASGSFQGSIVAPAALSVTKAGSGIQALIGNNTYTGGTTITSGTLLVSPQAAGVNPIGSGAVSLNTTGVTFAYRQLLPVPTTGYNRDEVWALNEGTTPNASKQVTGGFDVGGNEAFFETGMPGSTQNYPGVTTGMPHNRAINSLLGGGSTFILQPYNANNVLFMRAGETGNLSLYNPGSFKSINVIGASGNGPVATNVTLNYADGTTTAFTGLSTLDWFGGANPVINSLGRYQFGGDFYDNAGSGGSVVTGQNPRIYQLTLNLSAADQLKTLTSISVTNAGTGTVGVFGMNGTTSSAPATLSPGNNVSVTADSSLEVSGYAQVNLGTLSVGPNTVTMNGTSGSTMAYTGTTLNGAPTFNVTVGNLTLALGTVTDNNNGFGLTKTGPGILTIAGGSNYASGLVQVQGGILDVGTTSGLPNYATAGQVTVSAGATLAVGFDGTSAHWTTAQIGTPTTSGTLLGTVTLPSGSFFGLDVASGSPTFTSTGGFTLPAGVGFVKLGAGTVIMNGANTYGGGNQILGGELSTNLLANGGAPSGIGLSSNGAANLSFTNGGLLQYTGASTSTDRSFTLNTNVGTITGGGFDITNAGTTLIVSGAGTGSGALNKSGPGTLILTGSNNYSGGTNINAGTLQVGNGSNTGTLGSGLILDNGTLAYNLTVTATQANAISGTGGFVKNGSGLLTLSGVNTYTGPTTVNAGQLIAGSNSAFGVGSAVTVGSGTVLALNGNNESIGSLAGAGAVTNNSGTVNVTLTVGSNNTSTTFSGALQNGSTGTLTLTKVGNGTLTLTNTGNTYSGGTNVLSGTVSVASDAALGTGPVTAGSFGTLLFTATTASTKSFTLNGGTLSAAAGQTVTLNGGQISGGYLGGSGTFATGASGAQFANMTTRPSVTLVSSSALDVYNNVSNGGVLNVAPGLAAPVNFAGVTNQGSGAINVGAGSQVNLTDFQTYGLMSLAAGPSPTTPTQITNVGTSAAYFNGGSRTFISDIAHINGPAYFDLHGQNAIVAGGLFVNNGAVFDSLGSPTNHHNLIADYGATVKGAGAFQFTPVTQNGGKFSPGNSPGAASFGEFKVGQGGVTNYVFQIDDATGTAGPSPDAQGHVSGWGLSKAVSQIGPMTTSGNFVWGADSAHPLALAIDTLVNPTTVGTDIAGPMANFDPSLAYSWTAVEWTGGYSGPTNVAVLNASTAFDTSGVVNAFSGSFGWDFGSDGHSLNLTYTPVPEPGTLLLVGAAGFGFGWYRRRKAAK